MCLCVQCLPVPPSLALQLFIHMSDMNHHLKIVDSDTLTQQASNWGLSLAQQLCLAGSAIQKKL